MTSSRRPKLLDLFCGEGGAGMGYARAGFDVTGVDAVAQPRYPFAFVRGDALEYVAAHGPEYDVIHASPPCQAYSITAHLHSRRHPELVPATRDALEATGLPWVIENVPGAPMPGALVLCGSEFGLKAYDPRTREHLWLRRHRLFESNVFLFGAGGCNCAGRRIGGVYGGGSEDPEHARKVWHGGYTPSKQVRAELIGCNWMTRRGQAQAIPPAYTLFVGEQLLAHLDSTAPEGVAR